MAIIAPTPVANLPTPPDPNQAEAEFDTAAFTWSSDLNRWTGDMNALGSNVQNNATEAQSAATTATTKAGEASTSASSAAASASTATTKAGEALASADSAASSASTATTKANEASASAASAQSSAQAAAASAASIAGGPMAGPASSVDGEVVLFSGTGGNIVKRATGSGMAKLTSGVLSTASAGTDYVTPTGTETLTNKEISGGTFTNGYTEETYAPAAGASFTFDFANGTIQGYTTNANTTITLPAVVAGKGFSIQISFGGAHTLSWAGGAIAWAGGSAPSFSGASGKTDTVSFMANVAGTKWIGTAFALGSAT